MSIETILQEHLDSGKLVLLESTLTGDETARLMAVSADVEAVVTPPFADTEEGKRFAEFRAWIDGFLEGNELSVSEDPFEKPPDTMFARVDPVEKEFWSIRVMDPEDTPGIRGFGGFAGLDVFVALTWALREDIDDFDNEVTEIEDTWRDYFDDEPPFSGDSLDEYLTTYYFG